MGESHFFILIGLVIDGEPEFGFCLKPMENLLIYTHEHEVRILKNGVELETPKLDWNTSGELVLKHFSTTQKDFIFEHFKQRKAPYIHEMVSQLAPLFGKTNGYLGLRRTYFWDLAAPAAIMKKAGYQHSFFDSHGNLMLLNNGSVKCRSYYALPQNAPQDLIQWFKGTAKELQGDNL
jgi:3'-phosphoadenosine 5'-phosphosulfate (PAPS) 3'-phosphatase